jgi:hypothetical protein
MKIIHNLEIRIEGLENRTEDLENRKPLRGQKGPPGDISAAFRNVEEALYGMVEAELRRLKITTLRGEGDPSGQDGV